MEFTPQETAHILAALRFAQGHRITHLGHFDGEDFTQLSDAQMDALAERINSDGPDDGHYTVVGLFPDSDWDSSMWDASFVEWVEAGTPLAAAQAARVEAARKRLIPDDPEDEAAVNRAAEEFAPNTAILAVFPGWLGDQYDPLKEGQDHEEKTDHNGDE